MPSSKSKLGGFPGLIAAAQAKTSFLVNVALSVFHLPLKGGKVPSIVKDLEYCMFLGRKGEQSFQLPASMCFSIRTAIPVLFRAAS